MDEKCLNASKRRKIEDTVLQILKASDMETTTEFSVRSTAAGRLGFQLSSKTHRLLVRQLIDSYLLSTAADILKTSSSPCDVALDLEPSYNGKIICKLSDQRMVTVHEMNGTTMVDISDFCIKDGSMLPEKGMSFTATQWSSLMNSSSLIQEAIFKLKSQRRSADIAEQTEANMEDSNTDKSQTEAGISKVRRVVFPPIKRNQSRAKADIRNPVADPPALKSQTQASIPNLVSHNFESKRQNEDDISTSVVSIPSQGDLCHTANAKRPESRIRVQTSRLDGKNYHSWRHQMECFLNQLNIAYVLSEQCPSASFNPGSRSIEKDKSNAAIKRWTDDDCLCRHSILNSLCDNLFQVYSQKGYSARDLWEELKSVYDDDFGTKRSQMNKYIHFQMIDGVSVLEQVQELHQIADSIISSGTWIEECFHVGVIVSKLPSSWRKLRSRLMQEDFLTLNMLMHRLSVEEESRNCYKKDYVSKKDNAREPMVDSRLGTRKNETKRVCYGCGKEGHINKNCPDKKSEDRDKGHWKENEVVPPRADARVFDADKTI